MAMQHKKVSGMSGNEIYCLHKQGMEPGQLCLGNSVVSMGLKGAFRGGIASMMGGEVEAVTQLVHDGRKNAFERALQEARRYGGAGLIGASFEIVPIGGSLEFTTVGSTVHSRQPLADRSLSQFSTAADAQEYFCQVDSGFQPLHCVFGNVAYSIGVGKGISGGFRKMVRGEVPQYTQIFEHTRQLALERIVADARRFKANAVVGIETSITPLMGVQEMMMLGTASHHPLLDEYLNNPVTSDMTSQEMWNMVHIGYLPIRLVMGVSVYSLGFAGSISAAMKSVGQGEVTELTELLYEAREKALARIEQDAEACGADEVVGVRTRIYELAGGMVEFMAIGTAVKRIPGAQTQSSDLPPQAIIVDRDTFVDAAEGFEFTPQTTATATTSNTQTAQGPLSRLIGFIIAIAFVVFWIWAMFHGKHK